MTRTATEILIDIENRQITAEKRAVNIETLLKLLLAKFNKSPSMIPQAIMDSSINNISVAKSNKDNFDNKPKTSAFEKMAADFGISIDDNVIPVVSDSEAMVEAEVRGNVRNQRGQKANGAKASVAQFVTKNDLPILLANVEIFDMKDNLVNKIRTNPKGRWLTTLAPGDYKVHIQKEYPADSGRGSVDTTYQINVPQSDKPLELEPLTIT
jgi:hypothetical protein